MHWYCWKIILKIARSKQVHEMSFVSGNDLTKESAINRAKVGLLFTTQNDAAMDAKVIKAERVGPFASIEDAAKEKDISLV